MKTLSVALMLSAIGMALVIAVPAEAAKKYAIDDVNAAPVGETGGDT